MVFDRPLDQAYSYGVPDSLRAAIAVGKRVQVPFGRGDRPTIGYCVRLSETPPDRPVKNLLRVIDNQALLTDNLLRLTRWMADYYLCGWGQVLNAIIPAAVRDQAGTRATTYLEAVPQGEIPQPPAFSPKQTAALEQLRAADRPVELRSSAGWPIAVRYPCWPWCKRE